MFVVSFDVLYAIFLAEYIKPEKKNSLNNIVMNKLRERQSFLSKKDSWRKLFPPLINKKNQGHPFKQQDARELVMKIFLRVVSWHLFCLLCPTTSYSKKNPKFSSFP